ncbi:MAG: restriction endonuclease subunit S [Bacteroidota bacterium]
MPDLPEGWSESALGDVVTLKRGYDLPKRSRREGPVPVISSSGYSGNHNEAKVDAPGVVTGRYGTIGEVYYIEENFWPLNTALYVRSFHGNDPLFISYFLRTLNFEAYTDKAAVPGINRNHLHQERVVIPEPEEQQRIASVLRLLDDRIALNRRMNRTLEALAASLFRQRFVAFEGQGPLVDSGTPLRAIPEGWVVRPIGDVLKTVGGSTPSTKVAEFWDGGSVHWTTPKDLSSLDTPVLLDTARQITEAGLAKISSGLLPAGTVLMSSRAPVGYLAIAEIPVAVNQGYIAFPPSDEFSNLFILFWLRANMDRIVGRAGGTTFKEISKRGFRPMLMAVPPAELRAEFETVARPLYDRIVANEKQSRTLAALRDELLPELISGRLRVPETLDDLI